ncbi:MAG: thioredoxin-dependent thiol peroxidase [Pseudomonadota bacterium]
MSTVTVGETAPDFQLPTDQGEDVTLSDLRGQKVVLFFYPKDNTSGCTKEAVGFSETLDEFKAANTVVIGLSPDGVKSHAKFREKQELTVALVADEEHVALQAYDVWKEKSMYGKKYMGVERSTFLIDADGKISQEWRKVKVPGHVEKVLEAAKAL